MILKGNDGYGGGRGYLQIKIFYFLATKKTQGKWQEHREFGINWSVATLIKQTFSKETFKITAFSNVISELKTRSFFRVMSSRIETPRVRASEEAAGRIP